ncbi:hypothetical protein Ahy_B02g058756 isoform C [Arachis hypogaea]|uniref:chloroplast protein-transporting ATPase n=2 Tax=Arachis hypogaea TaxID=3818 RepID=A0A445AFD8_ARAHY|nr:hypothetical protein Ahy_B02g058756 isoform C [Arachis hypogaea]
MAVLNRSFDSKHHARDAVAPCLCNDLRSSCVLRRSSPVTSHSASISFGDISYSGDLLRLSFKAVCEDSSRVEKSIPPFAQQDQQQFVFRCFAAADVPPFLCLVPLPLSLTLPKLYLVGMLEAVLEAMDVNSKAQVTVLLGWTSHNKERDEMKQAKGRRWSDGLHQAVEAKEGLPIQNETVTLASISYQNFFLQFPKRCGMTGTSATKSTEFESIYKLKVTIVPTNKPMIRKDESNVVFRATSVKWRAVVVEISRMHKTGRPVLVGTTSMEQSDSLSEQLKEAGIPHEVLNAKPENVEREAEIVAQSGRLGAVTIATNMAGRGTDIILGGSAEFMARLKLLRELPKELQFLDLEAIGSVVTDVDMVKEAKPSFYLKNILPIILKNQVVHFVGFGNRLAFDPIPFELQVIFIYTDMNNENVGMI